jgi:cholesterol oxidase
MMSSTEHDARTGRWLSQDLSALHELQSLMPDLIFDALIVGSGYGGSMAAAELSGLCDEKTGRPWRAGLLERGREHLPGMFPSEASDLPNHIRWSTPNAQKPRGSRSGLLDLRIGTDVSALLANGLGGGSLINAGVMEKPRWTSSDALQQAPLTPELRDELDQLFDGVKCRLGAADIAGDNNIRLHPHVEKNGDLRKTASLQSLDPATFRPAAITVAMQTAGLYTQCSLCGDCMTGCNNNSKKSLDTNLLVEAKKSGLQVYTGASVLWFERDESQVWNVIVAFTDEHVRLRNGPIKIKTRNLIVSAGTFGSTELLKTSQEQSKGKLQFSSTLGTQFSCNGDNILGLHDTKKPVHATSDESVQFNQRYVGPTITGILDVPDDTNPAKRALMLQEFAVPAPLKRLFAEAFKTAASFNDLDKCDPTIHQASSGTNNQLEPQAVDDAVVDRTAIIGVIGHDKAQGLLQASLTNVLSEASYCEGLTHVVWPNAKHEIGLDASFKALEKYAENTKALSDDGYVLRNPMWRILTPAMEDVLGAARGPVLTVHPLGGCPMGANADVGVVDDCGLVFDAAPNQVKADTWQGSLVVLDGAIIPCSLGANPALTIATLAQRACQKLKVDWKLTKQAVQLDPTPAKWLERPIYRSVADCQPTKPIDTEVELAERLIGEVKLAHTGEIYVAELTLQYKPVTVKYMMEKLYRVLTVAQPIVGALNSGLPASQLRLFKKDTWHAQRLETANDVVRQHFVHFESPVDGTLEFLNREHSTKWCRMVRAGWAWWWNRGFRDIVQAVKEWWSDLSPSNKNLLTSICEKRKSAIQLASRAGEVRRFSYKLVATGNELCGAVEGEKILTYRHLANPFRQMTELKITAFPIPLVGQPILKLDGRFIAQQGVPVLRISKQENQVQALSELASLGAWMSRLLINNHLWSFRKPDRAPGRMPTLLPGIVDGLPLPEITEIEIDRATNIKQDGRRAVSGIPVKIRLTRYKTKPNCNGHPLLFIHGYSVSGTTFAHNAIPLSAAKYFWEQGRDIWILDMRTSPGMLTAFTRWALEDAALADIPVAVAHIKNATGYKTIDVFAHCIGAVMVSMAILTDHTNIDEVTKYLGIEKASQPKRYLKELEDLPSSIGRLILSQKGPALVYSNANAARSYLMRGLRKLMSEQYDFRIPLDQGIAAGLMDRLLNLLPYSDDEYQRENPLWPCKTTPWVGFRHRMDMLFGRDFELEGMADKTLESIEDLFGPINMETLSQTIHFIEQKVITNAAGRNVFVSPQRMAARWGLVGKTMSVHGEKNGLVEVETLLAMQELMNSANLGAKYTPVRFEGMGHQDCLIGTRAIEVFDKVERFLK